MQAHAPDGLEGTQTLNYGCSGLLDNTDISGKNDQGQKQQTHNDNDTDNVNENINTEFSDSDDNDWIVPYQDENGKWITDGEEDQDVSV